ncbi:MAG: guanylate kinase [Lachnospiraceae bacterium]|nr:guanylate kinase [Lachnospiraceae bacterium]
MNQKGSLIILSGFSGAGKGTVVKKLVKDYGYLISVSATTRKPREGEVDGVSYFFKTVDEFEHLIEEDGFIEYAQYVGNYYGTPKKYVEDQLEAGKNVILEIEVQGALNVKKQYPDALMIFITAPSVEELKARLEGRGTESQEVIEERMKRASEEVEEMTQYEYIVVNDIVEQCAADINSIVIAKHCELNQKLDFIEETRKGFANI